jgi:two-component sensor histidine kinase
MECAIPSSRDWTALPAPGTGAGPSWAGEAGWRPDSRALSLMAATASEGFALLRLEPQAAAGPLVLYSNPALERMIGGDPSAVGRFCQSARLDLASACRRAWRERAPVVIDAGETASDSWLRLRIEAVGAGEFTLLATDRTEEGRAARRHAEAFAELHHRLKNSLANTASLLELQASGDAAPALAEALRLAAHRVHAIADLHRLMCRVDGADSVDLALYIRDCCDRLARSLFSDGRVKLIVTTGQATVRFEHSASLGMILNELVTNAAKHACPPPRPGTIHVALAVDHDVLVLKVADNGPGLEGSPDSAKGLGMRLIRSLAKQLGAEFRVQSTRAGAAFEVRVPQARAAVHS